MSTISSGDSRVAQSNYRTAGYSVSTSVANLASGTRADANVADFSVGTVLASRVNTLKVAINNAGQAKSVLNTAKGALTAITDLIQRQKTIANTALSDSLTDNERGFLDNEFQAIADQINTIATTTNFNGKKLLDGSLGGGYKLNDASDTDPSDDLFSLTNAASGTILDGLTSSDVTGAGGLDIANAISLYDFTVVLDTGANTATITAKVKDENGDVATYTGNTTANTINSADSLTLNSISDGASLTIAFTNITTNIDLAISSDVTQLQTDLNAIFAKAYGGNLSFRVGATEDIDVNISSATTASIGIGGLSVSSRSNAEAAATALDTARDAVVTIQSKVSAKITQFDASIANNEISSQNADAARSSLLDTDYTAESTNFAESRVRVDAAAAVLAQLNTRIQNLLQLLRQ